MASAATIDRRAEIAAKLVGAFLRLTQDEESEQLLALRLLTLHMLEGYVPSAFSADLRGELERLLDRTEGCSLSLTQALDAELVQARADIYYVLARRNRRYVLPLQQDVEACLDYLADSGDLIYAWVCAELLCRCGLNLRFKPLLRPYKGVSRLHDLYWLTHQYLLATEYLHKPLPKLGWQERTSELIGAIDWVTSTSRTDLACEIALCLQLAGYSSHDSYLRLEEFLLSQISEEGILSDPTFVDCVTNQAHTTAAALLVFARYAHVDSNHKPTA